MTQASTTRRIAILPSPHDQLDPVAALVRWWTRHLADVFAGAPVTVAPLGDLESARAKRLPHAVSIALRPEDIFVADVVLPRGGAGAHAKALGLRIAGLAPRDPFDLEIVARRTAIEMTGEGGAEGARYQVAMARSVRLEELERIARRRGARRVWFHAEGATDLRLTTPRAANAARRGAIIDAALIGVALAAGVVAVQIWTRAIDRDTDALVAAEQSVRSAAVTRERATRENTLAEDFIAHGVLERRIGAVARDIAAINAATPDAAWWTRVRWQEAGVTVAGTSAAASAAIEDMSGALPGWAVSLSGPVRASDEDGLQSFEVRVTRAGVASDED